MKLRNGTPKPKRNFRRNGAAVVLASALLSGTACTNSPDNFGSRTGAVVGQLYKEQLEDEFGLIIEEVRLGDQNFNQEQVFSRQSLGRKGDDPSTGYETEETFDPSGGPISLKISYVEGQLRVKDLSRDGVDEVSKQWILQRLAARKDLILAAGQAGTFNALNIRLNATDVMYEEDPSRQVTTMGGDATKDNEVNLAFPRNAVPIAAEVFDQMFIHEISHLLGAAVSQDFLDNGEYSQEVNRMLNVCASIRRKAIDQIDTRLYGVITKLDQAVALEENPEIKESMRVLLSKYVDRSYIGLLPDGDPLYVEVQEPQFGAQAAICAHNTLARQRGMVQTQIGIEHDELAFARHLDSRSADYFYDAYNELLDLLQNDTIYKYLAESNYDPRNNFGHGYDNLNEQFATAIALLVNPEIAASKLASAPPEERALVVEFIDSSKEVLVAKFPELLPLVHACYADFQTALDGQPVNNLQTCQPGLAR